jgi:hypothetical protein
MRRCSLEKEGWEGGDSEDRVRIADALLSLSHCLAAVLIGLRGVVVVVVGLSS